MYTETSLDQEPKPAASEPGSSALSTDATTETEATVDSIGSDAWIGGDQYDADFRWRAEAVKFFHSVRWDLLAAIASKHHNATEYVYSDKFSIGQFNMVRRLTFADGISWAVRVRLPQEASPASFEHYNSQKALELEIAAMKFFKCMSKIPVPEVFAYDADPSNETGAAYMIIEYIHGSTAEELSERRDSGPSIYGTPEQDRKFRHQLAKVQAETLSFRFDKIGSLHDSPEAGFFIGPDIETGLGPWTSSADYYNDLADVLMQRIASNGPTRTFKNHFFCAPILLKHILSLCGEETNGPFRLINRDLGAHNVLVDGDFNIVGVVDFDAVGTAPLEGVAQYPVLTSMSIDPPGVVTTKPLAIQRIQREQKLKDGYKESLAQWEAALGNGPATVSARLETTAAFAHEGLTRCAAGLEQEIERWFESAVYMLRERFKQSVGEEKNGAVEETATEKAVPEA